MEAFTKFETNASVEDPHHALSSLARKLTLDLAQMLTYVRATEESHMVVSELCIGTSSAERECVRCQPLRNTS